jgi:hypothetical protein
MMKRFQTDEKVEDTDKNIQNSSRYDDQQYMNVQGEVGLFLLENKLHNEIDSCIDRLDKLERLADRYHEDGIGAKNDNNMAYYQRYAMAYERVQMIINARFGELPKIV